MQGISIYTEFFLSSQNVYVPWATDTLIKWHIRRQNILVNGESALTLDTVGWGTVGHTARKVVLQKFPIV